MIKLEQGKEYDAVSVVETFVSLQGESTYAGQACFFIRLSECNLRCRYCDTGYARVSGRATSVASLVDLVRVDKAPLCEITGGEPLLDPGFPALVGALRMQTDKAVLVETNGSCDLSLVPDGVVAIMDIKTPGSGEAGSFDILNLERLRPCDEVKLVLVDRGDYEWAAEFIARHDLTSRCHAVFFSPVVPRLDPQRVAAWMIEDRSPARLHLQMHRVWGVR